AERNDELGTGALGGICWAEQATASSRKSNPGTLCIVGAESSRVAVERQQQSSSTLFINYKLLILHEIQRAAPDRPTGSFGQFISKNTNPPEEQHAYFRLYRPATYRSRDVFRLPSS